MAWRGRIPCQALSARAGAEIARRPVPGRENRLPVRPAALRDRDTARHRTHSASSLAAGLCRFQRQLCRAALRRRSSHVLEHHALLRQFDASWLVRGYARLEGALKRSSEMVCARSRMARETLMQIADNAGRRFRSHVTWLVVADANRVRSRRTGTQSAARVAAKSSLRPRGGGGVW